LAYSPRRYARCDDPPAPVHGTENQFADQIYDYPSGIAQLNVTDGERSGFSATKPAANQNRE
jgi:hypothetical protein